MWKKWMQRTFDDDCSLLNRKIQFCQKLRQRKLSRALKLIAARTRRTRQVRVDTETKVKWFLQSIVEKCQMLFKKSFKLLVANKRIHNGSTRLSTLIKTVQSRTFLTNLTKNMIRDRKLSKKFAQFTKHKNQNLSQKILSFLSAHKNLQKSNNRLADTFRLNCEIFSTSKIFQTWSHHSLIDKNCLKNRIKKFQIHLLTNQVQRTLRLFRLLSFTTKTIRNDYLRIETLKKNAFMILKVLILEKRRDSLSKLLQKSFIGWRDMVKEQILMKKYIKESSAEGWDEEDDRGSTNQ
jgi:hypothetical protein